MPSQAHSEAQFSVLHGDQVPAGMAVEEIGTQMVPPREVVLGCGPTREHLVTRLALCQSRRAGQHGADSEEEASGILPVRHSYCLSARHTPGLNELMLIKGLWQIVLHCTSTTFHCQVVVELGKFEGKKFKNSNLKDGHAQMEEEPIHLHPFLKREGLTLNRKKTLAADSYPIMLWWSPLTGETGRLGQCGADTCFFTINRTYLHHHRTKAFLFY
eukprot:bmy_19749T0